MLSLLINSGMRLHEITENLNFDGYMWKEGPAGVKEIPAEVSEEDDEKPVKKRKRKKKSCKK